MKGIFGQIKKDVDAKVEEKAKDAQKIMKNVINKDTGALSDSVDIEKVSDSHYKVGINTAKLINDPRNAGKIDYTPYYYHGSRPHTIRAKPGKTLSWIGKDGNRHYAKSVKHPGNKPHDFLGETIKRMR